MFWTLSNRWGWRCAISMDTWGNPVEKQHFVFLNMMNRRVCEEIRGRKDKEQMTSWDIRCKSWPQVKCMEEIRLDEKSEVLTVLRLESAPGDSGENRWEQPRWPEWTGTVVRRWKGYAFKKSSCSWTDKENGDWLYLWATGSSLVERLALTLDGL